MADKPVPFLFCRYGFFVSGEILDANGQLKALQDLQGQFYPHGKKAEEEKKFDSVVMRPRQHEVDGKVVLSWSVGQKIGVRTRYNYDATADKLSPEYVQDSSIRYTDFVAVPDLGIVAIDDRAGDAHLGGRAAANRFRSIFRFLADDADVGIRLTTSPADVKLALQTWELTEFAFVARPFNPHPPGYLSEQLSEAFNKDGIGEYRAKAKPAVGKRMHPAGDGLIAAAVELSDAGYGQYSVKGVTSGGNVAQIKQPKFEQEKLKNQEHQSKLRELRVIINSEEFADDILISKTAKAIMNLYDGKPRTP